MAFCLQELGQEAKVLGFWGGLTGEWLKQKCLSKNIQCFGPEVKGLNRRCFILRSEEEKNIWSNTEILGPGPYIDQYDLDLFYTQFSLISKRADIICISGSTPSGTNPEAYYQLVKISKEQRKRVILDTSGIQFENALKACPFGLHINLDEAEAHFKTKDIKILIKNLANQVELIALTDGDKGLYLMYRNVLIHANVKLDQIFSTVGSGDCLTAGLAKAVCENMPIHEMARWGVACGAANCLREDLGMLYLKDVENLLQQVTIKEMCL